ncbi:metallophosphoesterase [Deinococcus wulumuqiensis]|uniref:Metallophosphoesterase n=1 Tax=Deinococcus wulumuqiensis TaxID=980427 RepID=A0A345IF53_9DEIO|nr:metallophosphoesterase family protein [Deinococcus wulumuqiensis]AXG98325.1 metallophosphoesterase [Deinococcus wulumuqiensis]
MTCRVAVLSDVHGNAFALEAVLDDIRQHAPDLIVNLGDQVWGQADPLRALELQRSLEAVEVRGNNDERLLAPVETLAPALRPLQAWLMERLPRQELTRLATLPTTASLFDGALLAAHGTPLTPWDSLLVGWQDGAYFRRSDEEIRCRLNSLTDAAVVLVGHMHREAVHKLEGQLLVSVGPVSSPADGDPRARWTCLTRRGGEWQVELRRVTYDWDAALAWELCHGPIGAVDHTAPPCFPWRGTASDFPCS